MTDQDKFKAMLWTKDGENGVECMLAQMDELGVWSLIDGSQPDSITFVPWHNVLAIECHKSIMQALGDDE